MDVDYYEESDDYDEESEQSADHDFEEHVQGERGWKVITTESLAADQSNYLQRVMETLGIRLHQARTLLIYYRWNVDILFGEFAELGQERIFKRAGLPLETASTCSDGSDLMCLVCFDDVSRLHSTRMSCNHEFCNECWSRHFTVSIKSGNCKRIRCMDDTCKAICDEDKVIEVLRHRDAEALERYQRSMLESYIEDNSNVKWCPSAPHCGNAIWTATGVTIYEVECACSHEFCFKCTKKPHSPCSCEMWEIWESSTNETSTWITANTKPCPKCKNLVQKVDGCNHVTCRCGGCFCWLCGGQTGRDHNWEGISNHSCGSYKEDYEKKIGDAMANLQRYNHYSSRWKAHHDSLKLEIKLADLAYAKVKELESHPSAEMVDYMWVEKSMQMLHKARRALCFSYPFAYYMFGNDMFKNQITHAQNIVNQNLFEDQQQQFERAIEILSKIMATFKDVEVVAKYDELQNLRLQSVNATLVANTVCQSMYKVIEDLLENTSHNIAAYNPHKY